MGEKPSVEEDKFAPQLYMYLYRTRKGKKRLSSHSKKVVPRKP